MMTCTKLRTWKFDDCTVTEGENDHSLKCLEVRWTDGGKTYTQTVLPSDEEDYGLCTYALDRGESPLNIWEDGLGRLVCTENAREEA